MAFGKIKDFDGKIGHIIEDETLNEYIFKLEDTFEPKELTPSSEVIFTPEISEKGFFAKNVISAESDVDDEDDFIGADE